VQRAGAEGVEGGTRHAAGNLAAVTGVSKAS
jgi:hypothetical protein